MAAEWANENSAALSKCSDEWDSSAPEPSLENLHLVWDVQEGVFQQLLIFWGSVKEGYKKSYKPGAGGSCL
jgi:hypothetical protein